MKILGIGNALVDVLIKLESEELLRVMQLSKGSMNLIDIDTRNSLFDGLKDHKMKMTTGGSAGNTCLALAHLGMPVGFVGKLGDDDLGEFYVKEYVESGIEPHFLFEPDPSGTAMVMISPDGERTFCTYLGVAAEMCKEDIESDVMTPYTHLYVEGYLVQNHSLIEGALSMAKAKGLTTAMDLASFNVVEEEREFLLDLIKNYVDIVFANELEARSLTGKEPEEAVREIGDIVSIAVVKTGADGSWVVCGGEPIHVSVEQIKPIDSTAAGDYYAAGFFYGMSKNKSLEECAEYGSILAGEVIQVIGTKLSPEVWGKIKSVVG